ncbi:TNF receptor-associated factor 6-like [Clytia hemisphaerica]|uniref:Uncharacterized protein n=1 Tax=Clytia hemisphaerica TaxID=252671 RepID=A0A7M5VA13_9CNID
MVEKMLSGGYDVEFATVYPEDNVTCAICLFILREPMQAIECGHRFCKSCVADLKKGDNGKHMCPEDRSEMNLFPDKGKEREILGRAVKCTNVRNGCSSVQELRNLEDHKEQCDFKIVKCVVESCAEEFQRRYEDQHYKKCKYRMVQCPFCNEDYISAFEEEHIEDCEEFLECCDFCDTVGIPRSKMNDHLTKACKKIPHSCKFASIGCQEKMILDKLRSHQSIATEHHLNLALDKICEQQDEIISLRNSQTKFSNLFNQRVGLSLKENHVWTILGFDEKLRLAKQQSDYLELTEDFYTSQGYKLNCCLESSRPFTPDNDDSKRRWFALYFCTIEGNFDEILKWPLVMSIEPSIGNDERDLLTLTTEFPKSFAKPPHGEGGYGYKQFTSEAQIMNVITDGTLTINIKTKQL